ncbi:hypothetical protein [uncultured Roseibium sp.]|uniref:hypothetical protein n=1 Tax=uncultured Roseibium sp. TaxID=1936171 RepID=UPI003217DB5D
MTWVAPVSVEPTGPTGKTGAPVPKPTLETASAEKAQSFGFKDFLDVINPLQHIPGISELYRAVTGDEISDGARYSGNALYGLALGGPIGFSVMTGYSIASSAIAGETKGAGPDPQMASIPVPQEKPVPVSQAAEVNTSPTGGEVLGAEVARVTGPGNGTPFDLTALLTGIAPDPKPATAVERTKDADANKDAQTVSPEVSLEKIAAHKDNHLPVDVLKALQERYLARANDESA